MPSDLELLGRLLLAAVLGGAVGAERELADQPAGLRTHMLLTMAPACSPWSRRMASAGPRPPVSGRPPRSGSRWAPAATCSPPAAPCSWSAPWSACARSATGCSAGRCRVRSPAVVAVSCWSPSCRPATAERLIDALTRLDGVHEVEWEG
jgi:hypothetical protein